MRLFRLYSGSDGQSHLEEIALSFSPGQFAEQSPMQPAAGISFSRMTPARLSIGIMRRAASM
jgi:hypothetical protein